MSVSLTFFGAKNVTYHIPDCLVYIKDVKLCLNFDNLLSMIISNHNIIAGGVFNWSMSPLEQRDA